MIYSEAEDIKISRLIVAILKKIWIILLITFIAGVFTYKTTSKPSSSEAVLHVTMKNDESRNTTSYYFLNSFTIVLEGDQAMQDLADTLVSTADINQLKKVFDVKDGKIDPGQVRKYVSTRVSYSHEMLMIDATTGDPDVSAALCNTLADLAYRYIDEVAAEGEVTIISRAVPGEVPGVMNDVFKKMAIAFILSSFVIVIYNILTNSVKDTNELVRICYRPVLAKLKTKGITGRNLSALIASHAVSQDVLENYKTIRTELLFSPEKTDSRTFVVSGVGTERNNPIIAANIALTFAQTGRKVLLIDADLRNPSQHNIFDTKLSKGLTSLLSGSSDEELPIRRGIEENLDLMTSGSVADSPSELLSSDQFAGLLKKLENIYDYIIISAPCLNDVGDALIVGSLAGNMVLSIKYYGTKYPDIVSALNRIDALKIKMYGFVVDGITDYGKLRFPGQTKVYSE